MKKKVQFTCAVSKALKAMIFSEGDTANRFYLIHSGRVELTSLSKEGIRVHIQTLQSNEVLGWSWLFPPHQWQFDAHAVEDTVATFFYGTLLRAKCEEDHYLGYELMSRVASVVVQRLQSARGRIV